MYKNHSTDCRSETLAATNPHPTLDFPFWLRRLGVQNDCLIEFRNGNDVRHSLVIARVSAEKEAQAWRELFFDAHASLIAAFVPG